MVTEKTQDLDPKRSARRRLMRGAFAAPAVLTLYSGSATAATSILNCVARQNGARVNPVPGVVTADDNYLRYQLWALVQSANSTVVDSYYIKGADLAVLVRLGQTPYLASTQWQQFNISTNVAGTISTTTPALSGYVLQRVNQFVVLRVDAGGKIVGAGDGTDGSAVGDSCWTSFAAGTN
jgi:hypothetical protein